MVDVSLHDRTSPMVAEAGKQELPNTVLERMRICLSHPAGTPACQASTAFGEWSNKALVDGLVTDHGWVRDKIHMMLVWKKDPEIPALLELLEKTPHVKARLHAMWILKPKAISHPGGSTRHGPQRMLECAVMV